MKLISIIVPVYNEEKNIQLLVDRLTGVTKKINTYAWEMVFVNDGSSDNSQTELEKAAHTNSHIKVIEFSRNFGKEIATTAGLHHCQGDACVMLDADLQHPPELIPEFIAKWEQGAEVILGIRKRDKSEGVIKRAGGWLFYKIINKISDTKLIPNSCDFRLLDRAVVNEFNRFTEKYRMTRALIDWLGFRRDFVHFHTGERMHGKAGYSVRKLFRLAFTSFIALSLFPLRFAGYLGVFIVLVSGTLGLFILIEKYILKDVWSLAISGTAVLAIILLFLVGIILSCLGLIALYIANIHSEVINRPIYVVRSKSNFSDIAMESKERIHSPF